LAPERRWGTRSGAVIAVAGAVLAAVLMPRRATKPSQEALMGIPQDD
jgi:DHA2 family multidrug resistance protein-like MFS transporter